MTWPGKRALEGTHDKRLALSPPFPSGELLSEWGEGALAAENSAGVFTQALAICEIAALTFLLFTTTLVEEFFCVAEDDGNWAGQQS